MNRQFFKDMKNGNKMLISKKYIYMFLSKCSILLIYHYYITEGFLV